MKNDLKSLQEYKEAIVLGIADAFKTSKNEAEAVLEYLESKDMLRIEAPQLIESPIESLVTRSRTANRLEMTSRKPGNLIINTYVDWRNVACTATTTIVTIEGLKSKNGYMIALSILGILFSASKLLDIKLNMNQTAIILALQKHSDYRKFSTSEDQCFREANEILLSCGYPEMTKTIFSEEETKLHQFKCIDISNGTLMLIEKVKFHY